MITGPLCRAARALTEISRDRLASVSGVDTKIIEHFERQLDTPDDATIEKLQETLENLGAVFIPEDTRGVGVRLKFTASETKRLSTLESEGGIVRPDDVP
ncbi:transcriptional regulator with XRE-family HTH domain [Paenochrobactrum gallinarii]|uniref:Transcriptional regulator with XRE-family HTH domain n=1 Tax=Paenochrobactrum gallinarii TaxID=643673 RepID=A0A841LSA4_9HYPH|nr:XRE family transcriptional regulator [Paenochrobactrum gallinarii]MBB6259780.1 transcriptional regulator with XRE-family HTH domain [Paenochrobactrum gallinarii]